MKQLNKDDAQAEMDARAADYWDAMQILAEQYSADPLIRQQQRVETIKYWLTVVVFSVVLGPLALLLLLWFGAAKGIPFLDFIELAVIRVLWLVCVMIGLPLTMMCVRPKAKLWVKMAMSDMDTLNPPYNHRAF